jgi:putative ABC transport system permease protein
VICAALLAMIVLYNLTNISITERMREIATIKVLGFRSRESAAYVFKENLLLSAMGTVLGLIGGIFLLRFVMSQIKIDMVWFQTRLEPMSFFWATVITMVSACVVDFLLYFKLERINMAEALKSVE